MKKSPEEIAKFHDQIFVDACRDLFSDLSQEERENRVRTFHSNSYTSTAILEDYRKSSLYQKSREIRFLDHYFEVRLQLYYLISATPEEYCDYTECLEDYSILTPHQRLKRVSIIQARIGQIRILWEKMMNWIYHLITGKLLENEVSGKKSKQLIFFQTIESSPKWKFISEYKDLINYFNSNYRTPEAHKGSVLKKEITGQARFNISVISSPISVVCNSIIPSTKTILKDLNQSPQMIRMSAWEEEAHLKKGTQPPDFLGEFFASISSSFTFSTDINSNND